MLQFRHAGPAPQIHEVISRFRLSPDEFDQGYGVVQTDSHEGLYTVMVDEAARDRVEQLLRQHQDASDPSVGFFANPRIEPFGPPVT